jgi:polygalacturonase
MAIKNGMRLIITSVAMLVMLTAWQVTKAQQYNIFDYGAKSDTNVISTEAINKAIMACNSKGGGQVVIPTGQFKSGTIVLKSNVELHFESGSVLLASTDTSDFPRQAQPAYRSQKDPGGWYALIYAEGQTNIRITGYGTIDGQGARQTPRLTTGGDLDGRPRNLLLISCNNVLVEGITMLNAGIWNQHYLNCEDVQIHRLKVYNHCNRNNDGLDIDGSRRVVVSDCIIDSDDDAIVLKSTGMAGCENVVITNCIVSSFTNAIKCGTESTGGFRNINIGNCVVKRSISKVPPIFGRTNIGISGISLEIVDGGIMEGVTVHDIMIEETECPIYVRLGNRARKHISEAPVPPLGQMRNIHISNITAYNTGNYTASITGVNAAKIENISLSHVRLVNRGGLKQGDFIANIDSVKEDEKGFPEPTVWKNLPVFGLFMRHVKDISVTDVSLVNTQSDPRPAFAAIDVDHLIMTLVRLEGSSSQPGILVRGVKQINTEKVKVISNR